MIAETERVLVRPLLESDLTDYRRLLSFPEMAVANGSTADISPDLLASWFEADRHSPFALAVVDRAQRRFIGCILYYQHDDHPVAGQPLAYDLGYFLEPAEWGRGLMTEAIQASFSLVRRASANTQVVWADCLRQNLRSRRVLEKLGFTPTATPATTAASEQASATVDWFQLKLEPTSN